MCNVGDDIEGNDKLSKLMPEKSLFKLSEDKCIKCRSATPVIVLHSKYPYCRECFIPATVHKFKALLGKNRVIRVDDKVLIWHKTGHPSTALLHFLRTGLDLTTPKRIRFIPIILFIEDHYNLSVIVRKEILEKINEEAKSFKFPIYYVSLSEYISHQVNSNSFVYEKYEKINITKSDEDCMKKIFAKKATKTAKKEMLQILQHQILINVAKHLKCSSVFVPEIGIDIASQLLTSMSLGRGAHTVYDICTVDTRDEEVKLLRPLRNFTIKELALYNHFHKLEPVTYTLPEENPYTSVQSLMNKFVTDLQFNYPATISTIIRTGDKLGTDKADQFNGKCLLCKVPIENEQKLLQSTEATNFSHWVSTQESNYAKPIEERTEQVINDFSTSYEKKYCFACSQISDFLL